MNIVGQSKLVLLLIILVFLILNLVGKIDQNSLLIVALFTIAYLVVEYLTQTYLNFVLAVRQTNLFPDNRAVNFLIWDVLKFILILVAIVSVLVLGINRILNNETIATLLGGLIGSLLTLKGSYSDLSISKNEQKSEDVLK